MMFLRYFFERDLSMAHCAVAALTIYSVYTEHYAAALIVFVAGVIACVAGEIALEKRA